MKFSLKLYRAVLRAVVELLEIFPPKMVEKAEVEMRKGGYPADKIPPEGTLWVHGASLGEIITLRPFVTELVTQYGRDRVLVTATTMDGYRQLLHDGICCHATLLPVELPEIVEPFIDRVRPKLLMISETEIWPLLCHTLGRRRIPYGIINGRINEKSVRMMKLFDSIFGETVKNMSFVFPQTRAYERRFKFLGAPVDKTFKLGCFKYDFSEPERNIEELRESYGIPVGRRVITFGSTHPEEEKTILEALEPVWRDLQATVVIAPRHMKRIAEVEDLLRERHLDYSTLSRKRLPAGHIILADTLGELRNLYAISSLAFVGGSLIPHGGHNLMEPAFFGVPIVSGPNTSNFPSETKALSAADAIFTASDRDSLRSLLSSFIEDPKRFRDAGDRGYRVLRNLAGASVETVRQLQGMGLLF